MQRVSDLKTLRKWCAENPRGIVVSDKIASRTQAHSQHLSSCNMLNTHFWPKDNRTYFCYDSEKELLARAESDGVSNRARCSRPGHNCYG